VTATFLIDPLEVLGVPADASLADIQAAYRARSKKFHPDAGGDEWTFRVLARCYELMSTARVMGRASEEFRRSPVVPDAGAAGEGPSGPAPGPAPDEVEVRLGVQQTEYPPARQVAVEMLLIRFELDATLGLLMGANEDRNLSCTLNMSWPARPGQAPAGTESARIARDLAEVFRLATRKTRPRSSWSEVQDGRFAGWLTYSTALQADQAFRLLRTESNRRELGFIQTIRDVTIPRDWHDA
jgi:hypothetical protein